jgi:hypothetical protein
VNLDPTWLGERTRTETLSFKVKLDRAGADRHEPALRRTQFGRHLDWLVEGDTLHVDYSCNLHYFGDAERHLRLFEDLLADPAVVVDADVEELDHGKSILVDLVRTIERLQGRIARRAALASAREFGLVPFTERQEASLDDRLEPIEAALRTLKPIEEALRDLQEGRTAPGGRGIVRRIRGGLAAAWASLTAWAGRAFRASR